MSRTTRPEDLRLEAWARVARASQPSFGERLFGVLITHALFVLVAAFFLMIAVGMLASAVPTLVTGTIGFGASFVVALAAYLIIRAAKLVM